MRSVSYLVILIAVVALAFAAPIKVHVVPHSHCDPGWIKTFEEYFTDVQHILSSVTENLYAHPERKFIWAETSFFHRWWTSTTAELQSKFKTILDRGQIEFVNGGWVMHDEAVTTFGADITQTTLGHQYLANLFGEKGRVRVGWSIDPFGLSQATAAMNKDFGYDYYVINRASWDGPGSRRDRRAKQEMEFLWKDEVTDKSIFTHLLYEHYGTFNGFHFEPTLFEYSPPVTSENVHERAQVFVDLIKNKFKPAYRTNHILFPLGDDMNYQNSSINFNNMTMLMDHVNANKDQYGIECVYSTLSEYFDSIQSPTQQWPTFSGEFFPYMEDEFKAWTGYYTSRPALKDHARIGERTARTTETLYTLANMANVMSHEPTRYQHLFSLRSANGLVQHHDAITGTEAEGALQDYHERLRKGIQENLIVDSEAISKLLGWNSIKMLTKQEPSYLRKLDQGDVVPIILFNSLAWDRTQIISMVTNRISFQVTDQQNTTYPTQVTPLEDDSIEISLRVKVPALGLKSLLLRVVNPTTHNQHLNQEASTEPIKTLSNENYNILIDPHSGGLIMVHNKLRDVSSKLDVQLRNYIPNTDGAHGQQSNPYIFRNIQQEAVPLNEQTSVKFASGPMYDQVTIKSQTLTQRMRLHKKSGSESNYFELAYRLGTLQPSTELIARFKSQNFDNEGTWQTDSNAWRSVQRKRTNEPHREEEKLWPVANNYYPMQYVASMKSTNKNEFTFLSNSSRGCASLSNDAIELMLHRRITNLTGLNIPLDDKAVSYMSLRVKLDVAEKSNNVQADAIEHNFPVEMYFVEDLKQAVGVTAREISLIKCNVPRNVHLQSLEPHVLRNVGERTLMRWRNLDEHKSSPVDVQLDDCFNVKELYETGLSGINLSKQEQRKVTLATSQTRTFIANIEK
ncbi:lysosomal alpha-mannosidase [Acrasis kona]|uniref:Alpha-mannosidase n=1 Tax=Acrasis kona TaxID=1008807 RepID=A0AAW2ZFS8_9EUKA